MEAPCGRQAPCEPSIPLTPAQDPRQDGRRARRVLRDAVMRAAQRVMRRSIKTGGSSISDYVRPDGSDGGYQDERRVYSRTGEPCSTCGTPIRRLVIATRSSHYCPTCQR